MNTFESIFATVEKAKSFGFKTLPNGTKLFGHVPHVAPEAWLHQIFPPMDSSDLAVFQEKVGINFPKALATFYAQTNGAGFFSVALSIYGKRTSYSRSGDDAWQPFCLVTANTIDRPGSLKPSQIVIGSYKSDGSLVLADNEQEVILRVKGPSSRVLNRWPDLDTMLISEITRLASLFDDTGHKLVDGPTTPL